MKGMNKTRSIQGFTLIEMLIVIAVISILAGIVLVGITGFQASARDTKRIGDLRSVQNSLELYYTRCGHYPHTGACGTAVTGEGDLAWDGAGSLLEKLSTDGVNVTDRIPTDPRTDQSYEYYYGDDGYGYVLKAELENDAASLDDGSELDGTAYTADCEDTASGWYYCIGSSN